MTKFLSSKILIGNIPVLILVIIQLLHPFNSSGQTSPGGVSNGLTLWVKADYEVYSDVGTNPCIDGSTVQQWNNNPNLSTLSFEQATVAKRPKYYNTNPTKLFNFNPLIEFDPTGANGNGDKLGLITQGTNLFGRNSLTTFMAQRLRATSSTQVWFKWQNCTTIGPGCERVGYENAGTNLRFDVMSDNNKGENVGNPAGFDITDYRAVMGVWASTLGANATYGNFTGGSRVRVDGFEGTNQTSNTSTANFSDIQELSIGSNNYFEDNYYSNLDISEVITYNRGLTSNERDKVDTYLGIKYGLSLFHHYISTDGSIIWNYGANTAYNYGIIGVGRDDLSALMQKQSKSMSRLNNASIEKDIVTLYIDSKAINNQSNLGTFSGGDKSFLLSGSNRSTPLAPIASENPIGIVQTLNREWFTQQLNFSNTDVFIEFDLSATTLPLTKTQLKFLLDDNGNFANATVLDSLASQMAINTIEKTVTVRVSAAQLKNLPYFTLGVVCYDLIGAYTFDNIDCFGNKNGAVRFSVPTTGVMPFQYSIDNGGSFQLSPSFVNLDAGQKILLIKDANGCTFRDTVNITEPPQITFASNSIPTSCPMILDGVAFVKDTAGGTGNLAIIWNNPVSSNDTIFNLSDGNYSFTITDENNCKANGIVKVNKGDRPNVTTDLPEYFACSGDSVYVIASGGDTYEILPSTGFVPINSANYFRGDSNAFGDYKIIGIDSKGCTDTVDIKVNRYPKITSAKYSLVNSACNQANGSAEITNVTGGMPVYQYRFNNGALGSTSIFYSLTAADYPVYIEDENGCTFNDTVKIINQQGVEDFYTSTSSEICSKQNGQIVIDSVKGGFPPYEYTLDASAMPTYQSVTTFNNLVDSIYMVTVRDNMGCTYSKNVVVAFVAGSLSLDLDILPEVCDRKVGSVEVLRVNGGVVPYSYKINSGIFQSEAKFSNLDSGNFVLQVKDNNGCTKDTVIEINFLKAPKPILQSQISPKCFGGNDGSVNASVMGGSGAITYTWLTSEGVVTGTTSQLTNARFGTYKLIVSDTNNCKDSVSVTLAQPDAVRATIATTLSQCTIPTGTATATATGGTGNFSYLWNTTPPQTTNVATALAGGKSYLLTLTDDNKCTFDTNVVIGTINSPTINIIQVDNITCYDSINGKISTNVTGGIRPYTYTWSAPPSATVLGNDSDISGLDVGSGVSKTYRLAVSDAAGCLANISQVITKPDTIKAIITPVPDPCGKKIGQIITSNISGGTGVLSYLWNDVNAQTTPNATALDSGNYQLTIKDVNGCLAQFSSTVQNIDGPKITAVLPQSVHCEGGDDGSISVVANGATALTYSWNKLPIPSSIIGTMDNVSNLDTGRYLITVMDANGCSIDSLITLGFDFFLPRFDFGLDTAFCENDSVLIGKIIAFADDYSWNTGATTPTMYTKTSGEYRLKVTKDGCSYEDTIQVRMDVVPDLNLGQDSIFCGSVLITLDITVNGVAYYEWKNGSTSSTQTITLPDEYWASISRNTCIVSDTVEFFSQPETKVTLPENQILCTGESYEIVSTISNAIAPQYEWNSGETTSNITVSQTGIYILTVVDDKCKSSDTIQVTFNAQPVVDLGVDLQSCEGEEVVLDIGNTNTGYTILWSTGEMSDTIIVTTYGTYSVTVTNLNCETTDEVVVNFNPIPVFSLAHDTIICLLDEIQIGIQLPNVDSYLWGNGELTPYIFSSGGSHTLTVTKSGCSYSDDINVFNNPLPEIPQLNTKKCRYDTITIDASCFDCVIYLWENGDTLSTQSIPHPVVKEIIVTNSYGCTSSQVVVITENYDPYCKPQFYVPNTFTPNGDGYNELFLPIFAGPELETFKFYVYNRWGEQIFYTESLKIGWDGYYRQILSQTDVYTWHIKYKIQGEAVFNELFGKVNLFR